jgi:hypothetical protein
MRRAACLAVLTVVAGCANPPPPPAQVATTPAPKPHRIAPAGVAALINDRPDQVTAALGPPILKRAENGGEVWLYANANGCSLDVVLFPSASGPKVAHATTRTPPTLNEEACLQAIADDAP